MVSAKNTLPGQKEEGQTGHHVGTSFEACSETNTSAALKELSVRVRVQMTDIESARGTNDATINLQNLMAQTFSPKTFKF